MSEPGASDSRHLSGQTGGEDLLCLDLGNSRLKALLFRAGRVAGRAACDARADQGEWEAALGPLLVAPALLCSVRPSLEAPLAAWLQGRGVTLRRVTGASPAPFPVRVRERETLGADRLCNAAAAWAENLRPAIIVDSGSALTLDALDAEGAYLGGLILPGIELILDALAAGGERLGRVEGIWAEQLLGRDTAEALASGATWGLLGAVEGLVRRLRRELGVSCPVILTGGGAGELVRRWDQGPCRLEADWTLKGLYALRGSGHSGPRPP